MRRTKGISGAQSCAVVPPKWLRDASLVGKYRSGRKRRSMLSSFLRREMLW